MGPQNIILIIKGPYILQPCKNEPSRFHQQEGLHAKWLDRDRVPWQSKMTFDKRLTPLYSLNPGPIAQP